MTSDLTSVTLINPGIHAHIAPNSSFGGLWGHGDLQMTSEVKADLKIELSDLNYLCSHAYLACKCFPEMIDTDNQQQTANYDP